MNSNYYPNPNKYITRIPNNNEDQTNYIKQQSNIINNNNNNVSENYNPPYNDMYTAIPGIFGKRFSPKQNPPKKDRYDPLTDFLHKKGLMDRDNALIYNTEYINIDSSYRNRHPIPQTDEIKWITLTNSPLRFKFNSNILEIIDLGMESNIRINDKIMISGLHPIKKVLKTIFGNNKKLFEFKNGSKYMKINYKHLMKFPDTNEDDSEYNKFNYIENYDTKNVEVEISGIQGESNTNYIGNIPVSTLNFIHQVFLYNPEEGAEKTFSDDSFYIELVSEYNNTSEFDLETYNIEIIYNYIAGIPINLINAEYPIDIDHAIGYHIVYNYSGESFQVQLKKVATLIDCSVCADGGKGECTGGNTVAIAKIEELFSSYPEPNHYTLKLPKVFNQVVYVKMISSEFPNVQNNIANSGSSKNNKLYWQNIDDGDIIYSVDLEMGTYNPSYLINILEEKIYQIKRIYTRNIDNNNNNIKYIDNNIIKINIDEVTNIVTFKSYSEVIISKPFVEINPPIEENVIPDGLISYNITIAQSMHRLNVGDIIIINNSLSHMGIPISVLNGEHVVSEVIDNNNYKIIVENFNLEQTFIDTKGGSAVHILMPNIFRLRFDFPDTMGNILGFRNYGSNIAITQYNSAITNKDEYDKELNINEEGNIITLDNNSLQFTAYNYIIMSCKQLRGIYNFGNIKNFFAKIQLPDAIKDTDKTILNSFVDAPIYFHDPIRNLTELEFEFYSPDGELYNFGGLDHSFTLEIVTMTENPKGTGITSSSGIIN